MTVQPYELRTESMLQRLVWGALAAGCGLALGTATSVTSAGAVALAAGMLMAIAAGVRPAIAAALLAVLVLFGKVVPSGLVVAYLLVAVVELALGRARIAATATLAWAGAFSVWALASALWTVDLGVAGEQFMGLGFAICFLVVSAALIASRGDLLLVIRAYALGAVVTGVIGLASFDPAAAGRASGVAGDPNIFAMYEVVALPMLFFLAGQAKGGWERWLAYGGALVVVAAVLLSLSRGGLLALALVLALLLLTPARSLYRSRLHKQGVVLVTLLVAGMSLSLVSGALSDRLSDTETATGSGRVNEWRSALNAFGDHPVIGLGFGGYFAASNELLRETPGVDLRRFRITATGIRVHSAYIGAAAELGIVGFALFVGLLGSTALALRRTARVARACGEVVLAGAATALLISLAAFAMASVFLSTEASFLFFTIVGVTIALQKLAGTRPGGHSA